MQPRYNLLYREIEAELLPLCRDQGIGVIAYNPLAGGFLSGKYQSADKLVPGTRFTLGKTGDLYRDRYWQQSQFEAVEQLRSISSRAADRWSRWPSPGCWPSPASPSPSSAPAGPNSWTTAWHRLI